MVGFYKDDFELGEKNIYILNVFFKKVIIFVKFFRKIFILRLIFFKVLVFREVRMYNLDILLLRNIVNFFKS